jgi:thiamine biosynthesis lipoprotein ApbE
MSRPSLRFHREALGCAFELRFPGDEDPSYVRSALESVWDELERVAAELDPGRPGSALAAANRMVAGERLRVPANLRDCLHLAQRLTGETAGAFDARLSPAASRAEWMEARAGAWRVEGSDLLCETPGWRLDLSDLARGLALDRMGTSLREWGLGHALLVAGGGIVLALDPPRDAEGWRLAVGDTEVSLAEQAVASFGGGEPQRMTDPRLGQSVPLPRPCRAVAAEAAEAAGLARALATAAPAETAAWMDGHHARGLWTAQGERLGAAARLSGPRS